MTNTNLLIIGSVTFVLGILTIPILIGVLCAPMGCFMMFLSLFLSGPSQSPVYMQQQYPGQMNPQQQQYAAQMQQQQHVNQMQQQQHANQMQQQHYAAQMQQQQYVQPSENPQGQPDFWNED